MLPTSDKQCMVSTNCCCYDIYTYELRGCRRIVPPLSVSYTQLTFLITTYNKLHVYITAMALQPMHVAIMGEPFGFFFYTLEKDKRKWSITVHKISPTGPFEINYKNIFDP